MSRTFFEAYFDPACPDKEHPEDWVWVPLTTASGILAMGDSTGHWRKKTIEEKEMEEAVRQVNEIAPGWKESAG